MFVSFDFFSMKKRYFCQRDRKIGREESHRPRAHLNIPTLLFPCQPSKIPHNTTSSWLFSEKLQQSYKNNGEVCFTQSKCFAASNVNILINGFFFFNSLLPYWRSHSHRAIRTLISEIPVEQRSTSIIERKRETQIEKRHVDFRKKHLHKQIKTRWAFAAGDLGRKE